MKLAAFTVFVLAGLFLAGVIAIVHHDALGAASCSLLFGVMLHQGASDVGRWLRRRNG